MPDHQTPHSAQETARQIARLAARLDEAGFHTEADCADYDLRFASHRLSANWITNGWNAVQLGMHGGEPLTMLSTMRVQVKNLQDTVMRQRGHLAPSVQALAQQLVQNILTWLERIQADQFQAGSASARWSETRTPVLRVASAGGMIESNARAALGVMQYLDREQVFPRGPQALKYITQAIYTLIVLANGSMSPESVSNQMIARELAGNGPMEQERKVPLQDQAEGVRQSLGKGATVLTKPISPTAQTSYSQESPGYDRESHIQRYLDYMKSYGFDAMIAHLKQHEGDMAFINEVKRRAIERQGSLHS